MAQQTHMLVWIEVWCDDEKAARIEMLPGVTSISIPKADGHRTVRVDGRYDPAEVAAEIKDIV